MPDGYDEEGNAFFFLRRTRFPRLSRWIIRRQSRRGFQLYWRWRLLGWIVCGGVAALANPRLIPLGIGAFELVILVLSLRAELRIRSVLSQCEHVRVTISILVWIHHVPCDRWDAPKNGVSPS